MLWDDTTFAQRMGKQGAEQLCALAHDALGRGRAGG